MRSFLRPCHNVFRNCGLSPIVNGSAHAKLCSNGSVFWCTSAEQAVSGQTSDGSEVKFAGTEGERPGSRFKINGGPSLKDFILSESRSVINDSADTHYIGPNDFSGGGRKGTFQVTRLRWAIIRVCRVE